MKTIAYIRVSTDKQDLENQTLTIHDYAYRKKISINDYIKIQISSNKSLKERLIEQLLQQLNIGDTLIVSELSRLGRSVGQIIQIVDYLIKEKIKFIAVKENILLNGQQDIQSKVMITMFGLFADIEKDLISIRTKQALAGVKASGKELGRPKGSLGKSKLDGKEREIMDLLDKKVSISSIAKIMSVSRNAVYKFIKSRKLAL